MANREEYIPPVGFAREPAAERRRWIGRILLVVIVLFIAWLALNRVINPPQETPFPTGGQTELPGPV